MAKKRTVIKGNYIISSGFPRVIKKGMVSLGSNAISMKRLSPETVSTGIDLCALNTCITNLIAL